MAKIVSASEVLSRKYKLKKASDLNKGSAGIDGRDGLNGKVGPQGPAGPAARDGHDGSDGNGFEWKGNYKPDNSYEPNDVVHYNGSSYICIKDAKGKPPSGAREYWELMAEAGSHGGGGGGPDLYVTGAEYDSDNTLILTMSNGDTVRAESPSTLVTSSFETVNKNLMSYGFAMNYTGSSLTSIVYTEGAAVITKTFGYAGGLLSTITLSGDIPTGINTVKTLQYSGTDLTGAIYS